MFSAVTRAIQCWCCHASGHAKWCHHAVSRHATRCCDKTISVYTPGMFRVGDATTSSHAQLGRHPAPPNRMHTYRYLQLAPLLLLTGDCCGVQHCIVWRANAIPVAAGAHNATLGQKSE